MKLSLDKVEAMCCRLGMPVGRMLREARVSRNTFYTLARKNSVVPKSLMRVAERLGVPVSALLIESYTSSGRIKNIINEMDRFLERHQDVDRDNVRHTLLLLNEKPVERLRRALRRGRSVNIR